MKPSIEPHAALRELRDLVATYLEGSDDAVRAQELLNALEPVDKVGPSARHMNTGAGHQARAEAASGAKFGVPSSAQEDRERALFGCATSDIDSALDGKSPRDVAMYATGVLSDVQELIRSFPSGFHGAWKVTDRDADTIRRLLNVAKYTNEKAVPR